MLETLNLKLIVICRLTGPETSSSLGKVQAQIDWETRSITHALNHKINNFWLNVVLIFVLTKFYKASVAWAKPRRVLIWLERIVPNEPRPGPVDLVSLLTSLKFNFRNWFKKKHLQNIFCGTARLRLQRLFGHHF